MDCRRCWNVCCTCCVGFSLLRFSTWCGMNPPHMPVLRPVSCTSPMCFPTGGHVSCCATLTDWATDSSTPVRVDFKLALLVYKALHNATAAYLVDDCQLVSHAGRRRLRSADIDTWCVPQTNTRLGDRSLTAAGPQLWNSLPARIR